MPDPADERRRQRRDFIRAHHPDRGGDPRVFVAGLAELDDPPRTGARPPQPRVVLVADVVWPISLFTAIRRRVTSGPRAPRVR